ncbi:hypothetical protein [Sphingomonas faeni]|uniref:hypothetical protein n=1 Tax=Sphingomonas faeni TaxID=185950 RepID=UPI0024137148|nr:hypothetical protein [Sphingomonas faeni]
MKNSTTTRRDLLRLGTTAAAYAAGASIVTGGIALASQAKGETLEGVSPGLIKAIAAFAAAERASAQYEATVYEPARLRWLAAKEAVPHTTVAPSPNWKMSPAFWSTDNREALAIAKGLVGSHPRTSKNPDVVRARGLIAAKHRRDRAVDRAGASVGIGPCCEESDRLSDQAADAASDVAAFPAKSLADIEAKMAFIIKHDMEPNGGMMEHMLADARRLLGREAR